jgi:hypothetical protein
MRLVMGGDERVFVGHRPGSLPVAGDYACPTMRLVATLVVRDEADIVDAQLAYHFAAGVDFIVATDHESHDGTTEILQEYERRGRLRLLRETGWVDEGRWRTRMARLAATDHGADWVINTDADEFWLPRNGRLKDAFEAVPGEFGVVFAVSRHFVPVPDGREPFSERMTTRVSPAAALNDPVSPYRPHGKAAHRGDPQIVVRHGAHRVENAALPPLLHWHPFDVLHFPYRSRAQYERKTARRAHGDSRLGQYVRGFHAREEGRLEDVYEAMTVDAERLRRGVCAGVVVVDTRLRDAMRVLEQPGGERSPTEAFRLDASVDVAPVEATSRDAVVDAAAFRDAEIVRLVRSLGDMEVRLAEVERRT